MIGTVNTYALSGLSGFGASAEADISHALPSFEIIGLPDTAVKEAKDRVRAGIRNSSFSFPAKRVVVNLAPASIKKEGTHFDLSIALSVLLADGQISGEGLDEYVFLGELSLSGDLRPVKGVLPIVLEAKKEGKVKFILPEGNASEAALADGIEVYGAKHLVEVVRHLSGEECILPTPHRGAELFHKDREYGVDFSEVKGQENLKRAMEIAAAGGHNMIMIGSPGSGKSMLAKRFPTILPEMTMEEALEVTKIYSISGMLSEEAPLVTVRPFRAPHHGVSAVSLVGGGSNPRPGEISLAHRGVLFLDELPEFSRTAMEALRQPMEDGEVTISRVQRKNTYPCSVMFLAAMNPCKCGYYGDGTDRCKCTPASVHQYASRISGPLLDRIDIEVEASPVPYSDLQLPPAESSKEIRARVNAARRIQEERYKDEGIFCNAQLSGHALSKYCVLGTAEEEMMKEVFDRLGLSARAYSRILKVARTIADLEGKEHISKLHLAEAISYRELDRKFF